MVLEETFDLNPDAILQDTSTMHQIVDAFWQEVAGKIPNSAASQLLKKIAIRDNRSSLESQADEPWRKEQVEAALEELMARRSGTH